ncbi:hypothetical protein [Lactobacillus delbrueckii]|uniref:hypothetical protein n=1 Tax=Lactobacillus delbrueckii TaxID=1584 RepID=UPI0021518058|nr:hypothetical protein [Lactobacillus delbrueckii]UUY35975.1 hypothetical protein NUU01_01480 [Lactobacillus delbrueckii subsp. bulgaricus]
MKKNFRQVFLATFFKKILPARREWFNLFVIFAKMIIITLDRNNLTKNLAKESEE